jgi:hypothetical protein
MGGCCGQRCRSQDSQSPPATIVGTTPQNEHNFSISFRDRTGRISRRNSIFESLRRAELNKITRVTHTKKCGVLLLLASFSFCFLMEQPPTIEWQTKVASGLYSGLRFAMHRAQDVWKFEQFELLSCKRAQTKSSFARIFFDMFSLRLLSFSKRDVGWTSAAPFSFLAVRGYSPRQRTHNKSAQNRVSGMICVSSFMSFSDVGSLADLD